MFTKYVNVNECAVRIDISKFANSEKTDISLILIPTLQSACASVKIAQQNKTRCVEM